MNIIGILSILVALGLIVSFYSRSKNKKQNENLQKEMEMLQKELVNKDEKIKERESESQRLKEALENEKKKVSREEERTDYAELKTKESSQLTAKVIKQSYESIKVLERKLEEQGRLLTNEKAEKDKIIQQIKAIQQEAKLKGINLIALPPSNV